MAEQKTMTVVGVPGDDRECWCLVVSEQQYRKVVGMDNYRRELELRKELEADGHPQGPWTVYPGDLIGEAGHKVEIKIKVRRV